MSEKVDIVECIQAAYTDVSKADAILLANRAMAWMTLLTATITEFVDRAKKSNNDAIEERAFVLASSVVSTVVSAKYPSEITKLTKLAVDFLTLTDSNATQV